MTAHGSEIPGMLELLQQLPAAVVVAGALGGEILLANRRAEEMVEHAHGAKVEDLPADVDLLGPADQPLTFEERLAYHASLLANGAEAVVGTDPQFRLTVWNPGPQRLYGLPAAAEGLATHRRCA